MDVKLGNFYKLKLCLHEFGLNLSFALSTEYLLSHAE